MTKRENDAIWTAAEKANRQCGQWMPQRWIEIFIKELASAPPATSAGLEEIARASNWKLVDGTMTTGESVIFDGSFIIAKVTRREDAELILALLSRDKLQS